MSQWPEALPCSSAMVEGWICKRFGFGLAWPICPTLHGAHGQPRVIVMLVRGAPKAPPLSYQVVLEQAMGEHLFTKRAGSSALFSAPRDAVNMSSLVTELDVPLTKRFRSVGPDVLDVPDIELPVASNKPESTRVCFRIVFTGVRKVISVPVGAGGVIKKGSVAITLHREHLATDDAVVVEQVASNSVDLPAHFVLAGFSDLERAQAEVLGKEFAPTR